jgi:hypothetical protein
MSAKASGTVVSVADEQADRRAAVSTTDRRRAFKKKLLDRVVEG